MTGLIDQLEEQAGDPGANLAAGIAARVIDTIAGFPASSADQRRAIALLVCLRVGDYVLAGSKSLAALSRSEDV